MRAFKHFIDGVGKKTILISCSLLVGALILILAYHYWGAALIADIYFERSFSFANDIFQGRDTHSLEFYQTRSDRLVYTTIKITLLASLLPYFFSYAARARSTIPSTGFSTDISLPVAATAFFFALLLSIAPLGFVTHPPLLDYPFHIARAYILNAWSESPSLQDWYDIQSFIIPNMGMDLGLLLLGKFLPIEIAGRVFIILIFALTLSGCMFLYTSLYKHISLWPLASSFFLFNGILLLGFVNYLFGIGVLLWAVGIWLRLGDQNHVSRLVFGTVVSSTLFFAHLVTLGLYAIVVAAYEIQRSLITYRSSKKAAAADLAVGASIFVVPLALFLLSSTAGEARTEIAYIQPYIWSKLRAFGSLLSGYQLVDGLQIILLTSFLLIGVLHGTFQIARPMFLALAMLLATYFLVPAQALSAALIDYRLPIAIAFLTIGSTKFALRNRTWYRAAVVGMAGFLALRAIVLSYTWAQDDEVITEYREALSRMAPNSILFVASGETSFKDTVQALGKKTPVNHLGSLATIEHGVFVPAIYAHPSQQPITVNNHYSAIKDFQNDGVIRLKTAETLDTVIGEIRRLSGDELNKQKAIYILIHYPKQPPPDGTQVIVSGSRFHLLQIERSPSSKLKSDLD